MDSSVQIQVKDLRPGLKNLTMILITLDIGKPSTTKDGHEVRSIRVADRTGSVNLSIWDEPGTLLQPGDIVRVHKAYASLFKNSLTLYIGKGGEIHKVGDFCLHFSETPNMSEESFVNPVAHSGPTDSSGSTGGGHGPQGGRGGGPAAEGGKGMGPGGAMMGGQGNRGERPGFGPGNQGVNRMGMKHGQANNPYHNNHLTPHNNNFPFPNNHLSHPEQVFSQNGVKIPRK